MPRVDRGPLTLHSSVHARIARVAAGTPRCLLGYNALPPARTTDSCEYKYYSGRYAAGGLSAMRCVHPPPGAARSTARDTISISSVLVVPRPFSYRVDHSLFGETRIRADLQ
jgi:hypothetical protein